MNDRLIAHIVGNRPHFMKLAPVDAALKDLGLATEILHTGQHYDDTLSGQFLRELDIELTAQLQATGGGHAQQTASMMVALENYWLSAPSLPSVAIVYGDTNTTLAAALTAAKLDIPIAHVEGGVRASAMQVQMPEEKNRIVVDVLSNWVYTPTSSCSQNLLREGFAAERIVEVGDVMYDHVLNQAKKSTTPNIVGSKYILATVHRPENTDHLHRLRVILDELVRLADDIVVVLCIHPRTENALRATGEFEHYRSRLHIIPPVNHTEMVSLLKEAEFIISDSGGVPREAAFLGKRSILLRRQAVWDELVDQNYSILAAPDDLGSIRKAIGEMRRNLKVELALTGFGNGNSAKLIAHHIVNVVFA